MILNIQKLTSDAVIPSYAKPGDAGMDLTATSMVYNTDENYVEFGTGLAMEIPAGHVALIFPRSSVSNFDMILSNCVGVIDSGYRGEIKFRFKMLPYFDDIVTSNSGATLGKLSLTQNLYHYKVGDRVGQMIILPYPQIEPNVVESLSESNRGQGGFGSTN